MWSFLEFSSDWRRLCVRLNSLASGVLPVASPSIFAIASLSLAIVLVVMTNVSGIRGLALNIFIAAWMDSIVGAAVVAVRFMRVVYLVRCGVFRVRFGCH